MAFITFAPDTGSFGTLSYQVPIVISQTQTKPEEPQTPQKKETLRELNHRLGYLITAYREGSNEYQKQHEQEYREARETLTERNKYLALSNAKRYKGRGVPLDDLIQGMRIALFECTANFDPKKGELSTIARSYFFQQYMNLLHEQRDSTFHLPGYLFDKRDKVDEIRNKLKETLQEPPTPEQIAEEFNKVYPGGESENPMNPRHIRGIEDYEKETELINKSNRNGEHFENKRAIAISIASPLEKYIQNEDLERMEIFVNSGILDEKEKAILSLFYGLNRNEAHSYGEISKIIGCKRQNIAYHHKKALEKLRSAMEPGESEKLEDKAA